MPVALRLLVTIGVLLACGASAQPSGEPAARRKPVELTARGEPLGDFLQRAAKMLNVGLSAARSLQGQRVTMFVSDATGDQLRSLIADLLSAEPEAPVKWSRDGSRGFRLEESLRRRQLAEALRDADLRLLQDHIRAELEWLRGAAGRELDGLKSGSVERRVVIDRAALAALVDLAGENGRARLLAGEPIPFRVGDQPEGSRRLLREFLADTSPARAALTPEELDKFSFVHILARSPHDSRGAMFLHSVVSPEGRCGSRGSGFKVPGARPPTFGIGAFRPDTPRPDDTSERVSLNLTPAISAPPGAEVGRNLNQLLEAVSRGCKLNVVADGYLRTRRKFPANLELRDYPLKQLLDGICGVWDCDWRYASKPERTILVRSRSWWMEDASDVPEAQVRHFGERLGRELNLEDLLELAELSVAQVHKLVETGACPSALGMVTPAFYDTADMKQALRFFNRLPPDLRSRALSQEGLPLAEAPPELVRRWLAGPLIAGAGAVTPELQREATFRVRAGSNPTTGAPGFAVSIVGQRENGTNWHRSVQLVRKSVQFGPNDPEGVPKPVPK